MAQMKGAFETGWFVLAALAASCGGEDGPVTAQIGAAAFAGRSGASYRAESKHFGFIAIRESDDTRIEVSIEGLEAKGIGVFAAGPAEASMISVTVDEETQSTRSMGTGSIEISEFTLEIEENNKTGKGRARGSFDAQLDGLSISEGSFDIPVWSGDICDQNVEARNAFDCG